MRDEFKILVRELSVQLGVKSEHVVVLFRGAIESAERTYEILRSPRDQQGLIPLVALIRVIRDVVGAILDIRGEYDEERAEGITRKIIERYFGAWR